MPAPPTCPECGAQLPHGAPHGLCPKCLLLGGVAPPAQPGESAPTSPASSHDTSLRHSFERQIAMTFPSERCVYLLPSLLYDRGDAAEAALCCHDEMFAAFVAEGYYPHRLGIQSMGMLPPTQHDSTAVGLRLKQALDSAAILALGRYEPNPTNL
jgi:hypothetical protein